MQNEKLTDNFWLNEFFRNKEIPYFVPARVLYLIREQAKMLQYFRGVVGNVPITISSGVRTDSDFMRLRSMGYNPSKTSDHNFGYPVKLTKGSTKYKKYGEYFVDSVGATDITTDIKPVTECFKEIVEDIMSKKSPYQPKQVIFEVSDKGNQWIHISNDPSIIFGEKYESFTGKKKQFLYSLNNGKSYKTYDPNNPPSILQ